MTAARLLKQREAAQYCGLSIAAFERAVTAGSLPMPVSLEGNERWCRKALDKALDILTGEADKPDYLRDFEIGNAMQDNSSTYPNSPGKPGLGSAHGVEGGGKPTELDFDQVMDRLEQNADAILRASGSGLRHYTMSATRQAIILAAWGAYRGAYKAGFEDAVTGLVARLSPRSLPTGGDDA